MRKQTKDLLAELKQNNQDFEFYPSTKEMLECVFNDAVTKKFRTNPLGSWRSVLDIGAGTALFKEVLDEHDEDRITYYAIEKSEIITQNYKSDIVVIGTDFYENTLIDKKADIVFCNPPYSEFVEWTTRILNEANSEYIYMIIPSRWKVNTHIQEVIKTLNISYSVLNSYTFANAERQARAIVDIVCFKKKISEYEESDPFSVWFNNTFKTSDKDNDKQFDTEVIKNKLVSLKNKDKINLLVEYYQEEMANVQKAFENICELDANTLKSIGLKKNVIKTALKDKIQNIKTKYWAELYNCVDTITDRLTSKTRYEMKQRFNALGVIDFTEGNIRAVVLWIVKNTYRYMESQLVDLYKHFSEFENVKRYKSNQKTFTAEQWRWHNWDNNFSHYSLDYRIIASEYWNNDYDWRGVSVNKDKALTATDDICTIAFNLGFKCTEKAVITEFGTKYFYLMNNNKPLFEVKVYKNGNAHYKFNTEFSKAFNVEAGRILGWLRNKGEAKEELDGEQYYNIMNNNQLLLGFNE